jgi:bacillithiol system protein YtxJ
MNELRTLADLEEVLASRKGKVVLYKHSTQCGVCDGALEAIEDFLKSHASAGSFYYLDLLAHRDVSNAIAQRLGVKHESPQAIVLDEGKVAAVLNHRAIRVPALEKALNPRLS